MIRRAFLVVGLVYLLAIPALSCTPTPVTTPPQAPAPAPAPTPAPAPMPEPVPEVPPKHQETPSAKPLESPEPSEPEKPADIMPWLACDVPEVQQAVLHLVTKYPIKTHEDVLVHELNFKGWFLRMRAEYVSEARKNIDNAHSLVKDKKAGGEVRPREVSAGEIALEVEKALDNLDKQVSFSFAYQENVIEWAEGQDDPEIKSESAIMGLIEAFDNYREEVSKVITKLEFILSYCRSGSQTAGSSA